MRFQRAEPDENYAVKFVSETGRWELGLVPMIFGVRVRAGLAGECWSVVDYCAGADTGFLLQLLSVVMIILESLPESVTEPEVADMMPGYERRPIDQDPCWTQLQAMAREASQRQEQAA